MNGSDPRRVTVALVVAALLEPLLTLIHELAHATVALTQTEGLVTVRVGRSPAAWRMRLGRLQLALHPRPGRNEPAGLATVYAKLGFGVRIAFFLAGPLAHSAAATAILVLAIHAQSTTFQIVGVLLLVMALRNLVPRERNGHPSDGRRLLDELRNRGAPQPPTSVLEASLAETRTRWWVLFTHIKQIPDWQRLGSLLAAAPTALGYAPEDRSDSHAALCKVAYAGWCWREAERGQPERLRQPVLDAIHAATRTGALEPLLTARAANALAASSTDLSLGCPGDSDAERQAFLSAAFERLPKHLADSTPIGFRTFAWRYGLALHDVERARRSTS
jgi:hypothetical protein